MEKTAFVGLIKKTIVKLRVHNATLRAGALAFFTVLPLSSLAVIILGILNLIYGEQQNFQVFIEQVDLIAGPTIANFLSELLKNAQSPINSVIDLSLTIVFSFVGLFGILSILQNTINQIWDEDKPKTGIYKQVKNRTLQLLFIGAIAVIVVIWSTFSPLLINLFLFITNPQTELVSSFLLRTFEMIMSFVLSTFLFALIFKQLAPIKIKWKDVALGSIITALIFTILNVIFGIYITVFRVNSLTGSAGTLILLLLWIYLTNLFMLFGAQFSKIYTQKYGSLKTK